jgi:L-ascorbate metabolism protein UlaG (beta-lactamase superfamily)
MPARRYALVLAGAIAAGAAGCARPATLTIRFIGNAAFELRDGRQTLLIDFPYESGAGGYMAFDSAAVRPRGRVLAVFTHAHRDHFDRTALLARGWPAYGPSGLLDSLPPNRVYARTDSADFGAFHVARIPEWHADLDHVAYLITWRGRRIYHSGDTMDPARLVAMPELDVALVQENLLCWMAQQRGARVPAREIVVFHHFPSGARGCLGARALRQGEALVVPAVGVPKARPRAGADPAAGAPAADPPEAGGRTGAHRSAPAPRS